MSWALASFLLLAVAVAAGLAWYERERPSSRVLALVAALAALAVVGRLAFAAIPNVKPTTDIVLFGGYALGAAPGFAVGAVAALVSNVFLSQGPWTVWQMAGWGAVGVLGAVMARVLRGREPSRLLLAAVCGFAGLAFGAWMDVYQWTLAARQDLDSYLAIAATSLPYNLAHAIGNVGFSLLIGPAFVRALRRYRRRFEVRWPAPAGAAAAGVLALVAVLALSSQALAASPASRAESYLLKAQNRDGGFGSGPGYDSNALFSGWAALGLAAADRNPRDVHRRRGKSLAAYVRRVQRSERDIGEVERTVMVLRAAGLSPSHFAGRDLAAEVRGHRRRDGSIGGYVSYTAFGVLALRAARQSAGSDTIAWLAASHNADGGFGLARSAQSDADMTGAALQALAVTGRSSGSVVRRAVAWLRAHQNGDGGFGLMAGAGSNTQSTSYAVQGLVAVGAAPGTVRRALTYIRGLQRADGSVAYSRSSTQTPVWVTAQALLAFRRAPLPVATAPLGPPPKTAGSTAPAHGHTPASGGGGASAPTAKPGKRQSPAAPAAKGGGGAGASAGADGSTPADLGTHAGRPTGVTLDQAPASGTSDGVSPWLLAGGAALVVALLVLFRRRLLRFARPPAGD